MPKKITKILLITEDFPSGLNGTSVKTRNTLIYLLKQGFQVDVCCFHFDDFKVHSLKHSRLKVFSVATQKSNKRSLKYFSYLLSLVLSLTPITLKRLFNLELAKKIATLVQKKHYQVVFFDGYSTLQYAQFVGVGTKIYIDDEDFTDLFRQRFQLEKSWLQKIFYFSEYLKSLCFEFSNFRLINQIWAISPNTQKRLEKVSGVKTVLMPTILPLQKNLYRGDGTNIVFTGTLNWRENIEGLEWFLINHWPTILKKIPLATLTVIGQGASDNLIEFLRQQPNVKYLGYAPDLSAEYKRAALAISPVLINAGIKVKTLTYLSFGLPVVSSEVAAWGLVSTKGVVVASENKFGRAVVALLKFPKLRKYLSRQARLNIKINYNERVLGEFLSQNLHFHE